MCLNPECKWCGSRSHLHRRAIWKGGTEMVVLCRSCQHLFPQQYGCIFVSPWAEMFTVSELRDLDLLRRFQND